MCQATIYNGRDTSDKGSWRHMHHFCDCVRFTNRAYSSLGNWMDMRYNLKIAIGGCDYVLDRASPDFHMIPEIRLQKGKALKLYRQEGKAITEFMEAIKGNPQLAQAYVELADIQKNNKKRQEALKTVTQGLRHVPDSKPLQRRYTELGGKLPYPEPVVQKPVSVPEEAVVDSPQPSTGESQVSTPSATDPGLEAADKPPAETTASPTPSPKIGSPTNPWCRFCPDPVDKQ